MDTIQLKTNIMCGSCIAKVSPVFNEKFGDNNWKVDIQNPQKILTVTGENINKEAVAQTVEKAGYQSENLH